MKFKLYEIGNRYSFSLDDFDSNKHFYLTANIKSSYKYAWQAYSDARALAMSTPCHIEAIKKQAAQDLTKEDVMDISAEEMIHQHYDSIYQMIEEKAEGEEDEKEKEIIYGEIKVIVSEILNIIKEVKDDKSESQLQEVIKKFRVLVRSKFSENLRKDVEEKEKMDDITDTPVAPSPQEQYDPSSPTQEISKSSNINDSFLIKESNSLLNDITLQIVEEYAKMVCKAIESKHPSSIYRISKDNSIIIMDSKTNNNLLKIQMNNELNMNSILPLDSISEIYPLHSKEFYQRYWKPIVTCVGHYVVNASDVIYGYLPDIPEGKKDFVVKSSGNRALLRFSTNIWELKASPIDAAQESKLSPENPKSPKEYTEDDFKEDTMVECIVPELTSIFGKKGIVVQVIPLQSHIELDVQFLEKERGIKRLTTDQIKIVNV